MSKPMSGGKRRFGEDNKDNSTSIAISAEEAERNYQIEMASKFFHCEEKGCEFQENRYLRQRKRAFYEYYEYLCTTHDRICCKCGWEIGYHYNTFSKALEGPKYGMLRDVNN